MSKGRSPFRSPLTWVGLASVLGISSVALGLPWDIDMADAQTVKAYEEVMRPLPEGVVAQDNLLSPKAFTHNVARGSAEASRIVPPTQTDARVELGGERYRQYCYPCHGEDGEKLGPVAQTENTPDRFPGIVPLAGAGGVAKARDDHWIYLTIRNGGANMPAYGHTMTDEEMWSIVYFVRTLDNAQYAQPDAAEESTP